jgi:hypothetical protein
MSLIRTVLQGTHLERPVAGTLGTLYYETDTNSLLRDNGLTWQELTGLDRIAYMQLVDFSTNSVGLPTGSSYIGSTGLVQKSTVEITTAASQSAYHANDAVLAAAGGVSEITNLARINGGSGYITNIRVATNKKSITPSLRLHFFNASNPTISADNANWKDLYADSSKRVGYYDMPSMTTPADSANSDMSRAVPLDNVLIPFVCATNTKSLWVAIETLTAFTPDNGQKFYIAIYADVN